MMDWEEAMEEAREELGYYPNEYVEDWDELIENARDVYEYYKQEEYEGFCEDAYYKHQEYLKSDRWKKLRLKVLERDKFVCKDCSKKASLNYYIILDVHHTNYDYIETKEEINYCISLCRECHKKRHNIVVKNKGEINES